jgi:hypothetical protein
MIYFGVSIRLAQKIVVSSCLNAINLIAHKMLLVLSS